MIRKLVPMLAIAVAGTLTVAAPAEAAAKPRVTYLEAAANKSSKCSKRQMLVRVLFAGTANSTAIRVKIKVKGKTVKNYLADDLETAYVPGDDALSHVGDFRGCLKAKSRSDVKVTITAYKGRQKARESVTAADRIWGC